MNTDFQWSEQEASFARSTPMWSAVNHNRRMSSIFEANCTGKFCVVHEAMNGCKNLKIH